MGSVLPAPGRVLPIHLLRFLSFSHAFFASIRANSPCFARLRQLPSVDAGSAKTTTEASQGWIRGNPSGRLFCSFSAGAGIDDGSLARLDPGDPVRAPFLRFSWAPEYGTGRPEVPVERQQRSRNPGEEADGGHRGIQKPGRFLPLREPAGLVFYWNCQDFTSRFSPANTRKRS